MKTQGNMIRALARNLFFPKPSLVRVITAHNAFQILLYILMTTESS